MKIILILLLLTTTCYAVDLNDSGHDWKNYTNEQKLELMDLIVTKLEADVDSKSCVEALNMFYAYSNVTEGNKFLDNKCFAVMSDMLNQ